MDEFTEEKHNDYLIVTTPYKSNKGWYDTNKSESGHNDRVLCSGAVASNMLHWWLEQNKTYIDRYLSKIKVIVKYLKCSNYIMDILMVYGQILV